MVNLRGNIDLVLTVEGQSISCSAVETLRSAGLVLGIPVHFRKALV